MPTRPSLAPLAGPALRLQPDARLVTLSREGHDRAFEEIVRRYRAPLVRFAGSIVPADRAEDVVQEAFARAHAALPQGDADLAIRAWLYRIVRNGALNDLRDQRPHEELDPEHDGVPQPPEVAARRAELAATVSAIGALPDAQREAIVKRELEGRGHEEIAADLGVSAGAARQLIFRARATLRSGLGSLMPLPAVRSLLEEGSTRAATVGAGGAAGLAAAGGGGGLALKTGAAVLIAGLAVGSGAALKSHRDQLPEAAEAATPRHGLDAASGDSSAPAGAAPSGRGTAGAGSPGHGANHGGEPNGPAGSSHAGAEDRDEGQSSESSHSGHGGGGGDEREDHSQSSHSGHGGGGDDEGEDHSGSGGGGDVGGGGDDGSPGSGGGDDEGDDPEPDDRPEQDLGD
ncbi:MAG: sigma-70 family RNA polymerase sigma factor [bacterium]